MLQRIAYGALAIAFLISLFLMDALVAAHARNWDSILGCLLRRGSVMPVAFVVLLLIGATELDHIFRLRSARPYCRFAYVMITLLLLAPWLSPCGLLGGSASQVEGLYWQMALMIVAVGGVGLVSVFQRRPDGVLRDASATLLIIGYIGFLGSFGLQIRCARDIPDGAGIWLLFLVVLVTKASDIGAYFVGSLFGRHKLLPSISPAKSVEGMIGGLLASAGVSVLLTSWMVAEFSPVRVDPNSPVPPVSLRDLPGLEEIALALSTGSPARETIFALLFGLVLSFAGQLGDLVESSFKRDASIKDSGKIIPRYGGILDLADSPVFAMPVGWFFLTAVWHVG